MNAFDSVSEGPSPIIGMRETNLGELPDLEVFGNVEAEPLTKKSSKPKGNQGDKKVVYESEGDTAEKYGSPELKQAIESL